MIRCTRCRHRAANSDNHDQALCCSCCAHLRAGGGWELSAPHAAPAPIQCPLEFLPLRSALLFGDVPCSPSEGDFILASVDVSHHADDPAAHWRLEAIRERRQRPGCALDDGALAAIGLRTAARFLAANREPGKSTET